jgi:dienelactone hydrolase
MLLAGVMTAAAVPVAPAAGAATLDCIGWLGDPVSGSAEWQKADLNNQRCAAEGLRILQESPAVAAAKTANANAGESNFVGDPFRAPRRWAGNRGRYQRITYTDRDGNTWPAALFGPRDAGGGPYPGVLLVCHACFPLPQTTENVGLWYWAAESLAEAGYVVLYATVGGNSASRTIDATDFFTATPASPTPRGEFNPWYKQLDRHRLGIVGHSGAAGVALNVGNSDRRYDAIVAWDPASSADLTGVTPRIPTMIQVADYTLREGPVPRPEKPIPAPGSKYTFFDTFRAAGVDVMQIAPRASTHLDWTHFAAANEGGARAPHRERHRALRSICRRALDRRRLL